MNKNPTKLNWEITTEFLFIDREKEVDCIFCPLFMDCQFGPGDHKKAVISFSYSKQNLIFFGPQSGVKSSSKRPRVAKKCILRSPITS